MTKPLLLLACLLMLLGSCTGHSSQRTAATDSIVADSTDFAHAVHFDHAKGIQVANHPGYKEVFIFTPRRARHPRPATSSIPAAISPR